MFSYFGYSLTAADLNGDGLDDLVVGAPLYHNHSHHDQGAVFVYMQKNFAYGGDGVMGTEVGRLAEEGVAGWGWGGAKGCSILYLREKNEFLVRDLIFFFYFYFLFFSLVWFLSVSWCISFFRCFFLFYFITSYFFFYFKNFTLSTCLQRLCISHIFSLRLSIASSFSLRHGWKRTGEITKTDEIDQKKQKKRETNEGDQMKQMKRNSRDQKQGRDETGKKEIKWKELKKPKKRELAKRVKGKR